jgi:hypothetical protein
MKKSIFTIVTGLFVVLCLSCERPPMGDCPGGDCPDRPGRDGLNPRRITGRGDIISQTITIEPFHSIENIGIADVYITIGEIPEFTINAQPNIINLITYEVLDGELILSIDKNVNIVSSKGIFIDITTPVIHKVTSMGTAFIRLSGPGQAKLYLNNTGTGSINAFNLQVDTCYVNLTGTGSCKVAVNELLDAVITGTGNIYYMGFPNIISHITGLGRLISSN